MAVKRRSKRPTEFSHVDGKGKIRMVAVGEKAVTERRAVAHAFLSMNPATLKRLKARRMAKGDVLTTAKLAGIAGAKQTSLLIPLCHPIPLNHVDILFEYSSKPAGVKITASASATGRTGVEMEALTAASVAALTVYDMCKAVDRGMTINKCQLLHKSGGRSGVWNRP